jgi:protein-S-isoprenylcysteine O-methyltransferase Ste14
MAGLTRAGIKGIVIQTAPSLVAFVILFAAAGTLDWINAWVYFVLTCLCLPIIFVILAKVNPQMLNSRGSYIKEGTKGFDRVWIALFPVLTLANLVVIGFDARRFHWSSMPIWLNILGAVLVTPASLIPTWAMAVNRFFECSVRIQVDRGQHVCKEGPYRFIRHPGYAGLILSMMTAPLVLGSCWGLVLTFILILGIITRTALEDRTLQKELPGYREYAQKVKYRLLPFIW